MKGRCERTGRSPAGFRQPPTNPQAQANVPAHSLAARRDHRPIETMVQIRCATKEARTGEQSSTTGARSAAPPARPDDLDNVDGGPERGVYIQMRGIEQ